MKKLTSVLFLLMVFMVGGLTAQISEDQKLKQEEFQRMQQQQLQEQTDQKIQANSQRLIRDLAPADARDFSNHPNSGVTVLEVPPDAINSNTSNNRAPESIYDTTHGTGGSAITATSSQGSFYGYEVTLGATNRNITSIAFDMFNFSGAVADYDITVRIYTDCPSDGATPDCGNGPGMLIAEQTGTVTPLPGRYTVSVDFPGSADVSSDADDNIYVMILPSEVDQGWVLGESVVTGGDPSGGVALCGNLSGCAFAAGNGTFGMTITADSGPVISFPWTSW